MVDITFAVQNVTEYGKSVSIKSEGFTVNQLVCVASHALSVALDNMENCGCDTCRERRDGLEAALAAIGVDISLVN